MAHLFGPPPTSGKARLPLTRPLGRSHQTVAEITTPLSSQNHFSRASLFGKVFFAKVARRRFLFGRKIPPPSPDFFQSRRTPAASKEHCLFSFPACWLPQSGIPRSHFDGFRLLLPPCPAGTLHFSEHFYLQTLTFLTSARQPRPVFFLMAILAISSPSCAILLPPVKPRGGLLTVSPAPPFPLYGNAFFPQ